VIGDYENPKVRLPGAGGAPEIASAAGEVIVMLRHSKRAFVEEVDFITSVGFGRKGTGREGHPGSGPRVVITDLGVLKPDPATLELELVAIHPGVEVGQVRDNTSWELRVADDLIVTDSPSTEELSILRDLKERTARAHAG
jgi:glutaconate CoA-transferase subunit B